MIGLISLAMALIGQPATPNRKFEGDWYISDKTDNNTGEREVYASRMHIDTKSHDIVTISLRCIEGKPAFVVEWFDIEFPDATALTIGAIADSDAEPVEKSYLFEKADPNNPANAGDRGLRASPETSASIIAALGQSKGITLTANLPNKSRTVWTGINGTQAAWKRISRHCPVVKIPQPAL